MAQDNDWARDESWGTVASGLRIYFSYALMTVVFGLLVALISYAIASGGSYKAMKSLITLTRIAAAIGIGLSILGIVGLNKISRIPDHSGARGAATGALILSVIGLVIGIITLVPLLGDIRVRDLGSNGLWDIVARIVGLAQIFTLLGALKALSEYIGRQDLASQAVTVMTLIGVAVCLFLLLLLTGKVPVMALVLGLAALGLVIWALVAFLVLLSRLARAVTKDVSLPEQFS